MKILKYAFVVLTVILTTSLYAQWTIIEYSNDFSFEDILFLNEEEGFVVGRTFEESSSWFDCCGVILRTIDGGNTWDTTLTDTQVRAIYFLDKDTGFAASNQLLFYKTTDGGDNWETIVIGTPEPSFLANNYFTSLYFKNANEGYMSGHLLGRPTFRTFDGGYTWEPIINVINNPNDPVRGSKVSFPTNLTGYVGNKYKTVDGGLNWYGTDSMITTDLFSYNNQCTDFLTDQFGMAGHNITVGLPSDWKHALLGVTNDGGLNWNYHIFPELESIYDIEIFNQDQAYAAAKYTIWDMGPNTSGVIATVDGGNTWGYQILLPDSMRQSISKVYCFDEKTAFAVGYGAKIAADGTATWGGGVIYKTETSGGPMLSMTETYNDASVFKELLLSVYPNPANSIINIKCEFVIEQIEIYNISGELLQSIAVNSDNPQIDISSFSAGTYFVKVLGKEELVFGRFIKL